MIEIGLSGALHIREERLSARYDACRLLYVSDIHLRNGRSDMLAGKWWMPLPDAGRTRFCLAETSSIVRRNWTS